MPGEETIESVCSTKGRFIVCKMDGVYSVNGRYTPVSTGSFLSADKELPDLRLRDRDPGVLCSPKTGFASVHQTQTTAVLLVTKHGEVAVCGCWFSR